MDQHYLKTLSNYLGCADYIPFRAPPYSVQGPYDGENDDHRILPFGALRFV